MELWKIPSFISLNFIRKLHIPIPSIELQQQIVAEIESEQSLVSANRKLITRFEKKIEAVLARVWGGGTAPASDL